ncbi:MAG: DUF2335 domain-containing protein [bacterium]|nr:DUF2335 domain-containing protein [bacterium]MDZ4285971.1 DUF2335 domain-containing protein [Candidatus Sungbacteria bacterium]
MELIHQESKVKKTDGNTSIIATHFAGPLPHPDIMERYEQIVPGSADRIIKKFESQTEHRQKLESRFVLAEMIRSIGGLVGGFIIAMTALVGGIYTVLKGHTFLGGSLSFAGLALLVGVFLGNKFLKNRDGS